MALPFVSVVVGRGDGRCEKEWETIDKVGATSGDEQGVGLAEKEIAR